jgi:hypothetical protein
MKQLWGLALLLSFETFAQDLTRVPFYFAVTEEAHLPLKDKTWTKIPVKGIETNKAYLRGYRFTDGSVVGRKNAMKQLLAKEILQTGDVVLSFRPEWESTIPYSHIQMGVSHASLAYVENGVVKNLDMPLDPDYNGVNLSGGYDSKHYLETSYLQVLRPRNFSGTQKKNLLAWIAELKKNYASIRAKQLLKFNSDYFATKIDKYGKEDSFVTTMARILKKKNETSTDLTMFCSEYVWAMLSLSNCEVTDPEIGDETVADASCVRPIAEAMTLTPNKNLPGLTMGPLMVLKDLDISSAEKAELTKALFTQGEMSSLSSGHRALAQNPMVASLIDGLKVYYPAALAGNTGTMAAIQAKINPVGGRNYSPSFFLINSLLDSTDPERKFDYVATLIFKP